MSSRTIRRGILWGTPQAPSGSVGQGTAPVYFGYGAATTGGAGGVTIAVTNLNTSGAGSLRAALETAGARIVTFSVGGTCDMTADSANAQVIEINNGDLTIAGETAPTPFQLRGGTLKVQASNVIVRHFRSRVGDEFGGPPDVESDAEDVDGMTLNGLDSPISDILIDHCSFMWGPDVGGLVIIGNVSDVTIQNCIIGPGLRLSMHSGGEDTGNPNNTGHAYGANHSVSINDVTAYASRVTWYRNLFLGQRARNPRIVGGEAIDVINNLVYNWRQQAMHGNPRSANIVHNYLKTGPENDASNYVWETQTDAEYPLNEANSTDRVWVDGNVIETAGSFVAAPNNWADFLTQQSASIRGTLSLTPDPATTVKGIVLANAGARLPSLDAVDAEMLAHVTNTTSTIYNGLLDYHGNAAAAPHPHWDY